MHTFMAHCTCVVEYVTISLCLTLFHISSTTTTQMSE